MVSKIGENTVVVGNVHGDGDLEIRGRVLGDVTVEGNVAVASGAEVKGSISAGAISVAGSVEGNLEASDTVSIEPEARVLGDMTTPRISIGEGAVVRGMLRTDEAPPAPQKQSTARQPIAAPPPPPVLKANPPPPPTNIEPREVDPRAEVNAPAAEQAPPRKKGKGKQKRPPEPKVPALAKGTKGKKKGDKH